MHGCNDGAAGSKSGGGGMRASKDRWAGTGEAECVVYSNWQISSSLQSDLKSHG